MLTHADTVPKRSMKLVFGRFLANVNSTYTFAIGLCTSSCVRLSSVCRLSVCNVCAPYSGDWNFQQYCYTIRTIIYPSLL